MFFGEEKKKEIYDKIKELAHHKSKRTSLEYYRKILKARLMKKALSEGITSVSAQEREAYSNPDYEAVVNGIEVAVEEETRLWWELRMFEIEIQTWRTEQANTRVDSF